MAKIDGRPNRVTFEDRKDTHISPELVHLKIIEALMKGQKSISAENSSKAQKDTERVEMKKAEEVGDLKGYQYLTNNLLLKLNGQVVKDVNSLIYKVNKFEKAAGLGLTELNVESYWWHDRMSKIEDILSSYDRKITHLEEENSNIRKSLQDILELLQKHKEVVNETDEHTDKALTEVTHRVKKNEDIIETLQNGHNDIKKTIRSNTLILHKVQANMEKDSNNKIEPTKLAPEAINISRDVSASLNNELKTLCQFAVQMNDKVSGVSKRILANEYKISDLDTRLNRIDKRCVQTSIHHENKQRISDEMIQSLIQQLKYDINQCVKMLSQDFVPSDKHDYGSSLMKRHDNIGTNPTHEELINDIHTEKGHDYGSLLMKKHDNIGTSPAHEELIDYIYTEKGVPFGCDYNGKLDNRSNPVISRPMTYTKYSEDENNVSVTDNSIIDKLQNMCERNKTLIEDLYETQHTHELELLNLQNGDLKISGKEKNSENQSIPTKLDTGSIVQKHFAPLRECNSMIETCSQDRDIKSQLQIRTSKDINLFHAKKDKFEENRKSVIDSHYNPFTTIKCKNLNNRLCPSTQNTFTTCLKELENLLQNRINEKVSKIDSLDSKVASIESKVHRFCKRKSSLKIKIDAINVKQNACLSKWDKLDVDFDVGGGSQKTTYVIHRKRPQKTV